MSKKSILLLMVIALTLLVVSTTAFAETTSKWSESYSGVYYQYVNDNGGNDYNVLRWYNANNVKVSVSYTIRLSDGGTTTNLQYLAQKSEKGHQLNCSLAPGARLVKDSISVQAVQ